MILIKKEGVSKGHLLFLLMFISFLFFQKETNQSKEAILKVVFNHEGHEGKTMIIMSLCPLWLRDLDF